MTTMDTGTDAQKLEQLIGLKRRKIALLAQLRDAGVGSTGNTPTPPAGPDTAALAAGLESSRAYGGQGERDLASMFPSGQAPALLNPEPWKAADPNSGFNRPGGTGLSPEERMVGVQPNYAGMAPPVRSSVQAYYQRTGNTDVPPDLIPMDWSQRGQGIEATRPSGLSPEELAVQQRRAIRDIETQRYAQAMGEQTGGVVDSAIRGAVAPANTVLRSLIGYADAQGNPALTEAVDAATRARPEGMPARIASGAASMAPVLTVGALGGTPALLGAMGAQSFTDAFRQYQADLERRGDTHATGKALAAAAAIAPLEAGLNVIPAHRFLGALERAAPGFGAFLRARAVDAATNAGIGAAADLTRQAGGVASGAQDQIDLRQTLEAMPEQAAVGGVVGGAMAAHGIGARGERMGQIRDVRQAQADARSTGGVPERAGAYQPRPVNPWEQNKAAPSAPIGRGTARAQVPDGAGPPASTDTNLHQPAPDAAGASGYTLQDLGRSTEAARGTGGISSEVREQGLVPAFRDGETGKVYPSKYPPGWANKGDPERPAGVHIMDGLPDEVVVTRDVTDPQTVLAVKPSIEPGFTDSAGKFYTREEAAAHKANADLYPRARQILDELGVPDAGEVADRLGITLPEADRLVGRWEQEQAPPATPAASTGDPERSRIPAPEARTSDAAPESSSAVGSSPNSTRPALGSSGLNIPLSVVSEATRQRDAARENIARQSRPFAPPGRAAETERRSVLNRFRNPDTAGYSTEGSLTPEGVFRREPAAESSPTGRQPSPRSPAPPSDATARPAGDRASASDASSRSSGEGTREGGNKPETNATEKLPTREQHTNLDKSWIGRTLYAWRDRLNVQLRKGEKAKSDLGNRSVRGMTVRQRADFTTIPTDATRLVQWISDRTPEVWKLEGTAGRGWTMVPKKLVEKAKAAVPDWEADVKANAERKAARMDKIWENRRKRAEAEQNKQAAAAEAAKKAEIDHARGMGPDEWAALSEKNPAHAERLAVMLEAEESANGSPVPEWTTDHLDAIAEESAGRPSGEEVPPVQGDEAQGRGESGRGVGGRASDNRGIFGQHTEGLTGRQPDLLDVAADEKPATDRPGIRAGETPAQYDKRMGTTDTPSMLSKLADTIAAKAEALKAGPGVRQGKGGKGTRAGASDLHKVAGYAAMKAAEGAIRLADTVQGYAEKGIRITREMAEDAIRRFKGSHDPAEVMRLGNRMIRAATNKDGTIDPHKLELARAEMISRAVDEAPEPTQAQRDRQQQKAVNTAAAIERGKGQDSAAVREEMALRMGTAKGKRKLSEQAEAHREAMQAQRESFADKLDELRAQKAVGLDVRREIVKLAKEKLDPADRFRIMDFLAGADFKNPTSKKSDVTRDIIAGVTRILHIADTAAERRSKAELRAIVGKAARPSTGPKLAGEVNADLGVKGEPKKLARGTVNARDVAQLRTPVRDALTEVVDSLRNDHTTGAGKLADFLEKQGTAEADMSVGVSDYFSAEELARIKAMDNKLSDDLTPDDRTLLGNAIKHAAHLSAEGDKFQVGSEKRAFGEVKAKTIEEVKTRGKEAANPQRAIEGGAGKLLQGAKELVTTDQMDLSRMLGTVAGTDSTLHDTAYKALADGESAQKLLVREAMDKSGLKDWKAKDIARANQRRTVKLSSGVQKLRGWEMMEILGHYMDPSTQHEIEQAPFLREADKGKHKDRAFFATREDLATIESMLTARERALVPKLHDALKLVYREANDAHEDLLGFRLPDQPFHWSRVRDRTKVNEGLDARVARQTRFEDSPMYKERTGSKEPIVLRNPFEWVPEAIHHHAGMAKLARPMRNVRRLLNDPEVRSALTTAGGDNFLTKAEGRIAELVPAPGSGDGTAINRIMQGLLGRYASAKLAFRISSVAKQRLGLFQAASVADDPKLAARLTTEAFKPLPILPAEANRLRAEINPRSGYLSERADPAFAATLQSAANPHLKVATTAVGQAWNAVERVGLSGLQAADSGVVLRTYRSVKAHLEGQGFMGGELLDRAVRQTEHIIRDSQNPTSPLDMSGINLAGRKNPWLGAALMFTSSANKMRNIMVQTISDTRADPSAKNLGKLAKVTALTGANAIAEYGIGLATGGAAIGAIASWASGGDDERKKVGMAQKVLANLADVVQPGAGDAIRTIQNPDSAGTTIGKAITAARAVAKVADDETMRGSDKAVRIINAARALLPIVPDAPLDYAQNIIRGVAGSEMTNQTGGIKAALQRGDEKSLEQARQRIQKYIAAKVAEPAKEFTEAEDPQDKAERVRAGLRSRLLKLSGTRFDKLSQEQQETLEGMDNPPDWYAAERAKYDEWAAKVEKLLPE